MILEKKQKIILLVGLLICVAIGFVGGWFVKYKTLQLDDAPTPLRLGGFRFISPLLVCDTVTGIASEKLLPLKNQLEEKVQQAQQNNTIQITSIYYRDLKTGEEIAINNKEKFYPASLRKVPLVMALYKAVENNPDYLVQTKVNLTGTDQNSQQEIMPKKFAETGKTYSLKELVENTIISSDNNSASALTTMAGEESLVSLFEKLQVPFVVFNGDFINVDNRDFITAHDYSIFLRVLYNATYLNTDRSEELVELLTRVDYKNGLVAGVPEKILVAHKFGLLSEKDEKTNVVFSRQLHDCGIIYHPESPYILCVMTKSMAPIPEIGGFIQDISATVYREVDTLSQ